MYESYSVWDLEFLHETANPEDQAFGRVRLEILQYRIAPAVSTCLIPLAVHFSSGTKFNLLVKFSTICDINAFLRVCFHSHLYPPVIVFFQITGKFHQPDSGIQIFGDSLTCIPGSDAAHPDNNISIKLRLPAR